MLRAGTQHLASPRNYDPRRLIRRVWCGFQERQSWRFRDLVLLAGIATRPPRGCWWMGAQSLVVADEMRHLQSYLGPLDHLIGAVVHLVTVDY